MKMLLHATVPQGGATVECGVRASLSHVSMSHVIGGEDGWTGPRYLGQDPARKTGRARSKTSPGTSPHFELVRGGGALNPQGQRTSAKGWEGAAADGTQTPLSFSPPPQSLSFCLCLSVCLALLSSILCLSLSLSLPRTSSLSPVLGENMSGNASRSQKRASGVLNQSSVATRLGLNSITAAV